MNQKGPLANCSEVIPNYSPNKMLRRLEVIAIRVGIEESTLYKFRRSYATRLSENGAHIVTVQHLFGHSDIETTREYLRPNDGFKRKAANLLSLKGKSEIQ